MTTLSRDDQEALDEYLVACRAYKAKPSMATEMRMGTCFFALLGHVQAPALKAAKDEGLL